MNLIELSIKLFTLDSNNRNRTIKTFLPLLGTSIGVFVFIITFTLMESIETDMKENISKIIAQNKISLNNLNKNEKNEIEKILIAKQKDFFIIQEGRYLIENHNNLNLINVLIIDDLNFFVQKKFNDNVEYLHQDLHLIIGHQYLNNMNRINIISCTNFNYLTGIPNKYNLNVDGLISFDFMNFDDNYILLSKTLAKNEQIKNHNRYIYVDSYLDDNDKEEIFSINKNIKINNWKDEYSNLFYSIKIEKFLYSIFGIIIIIISNFTFLVGLSSLLTNKIKQFGILQIMGFNNQKITIIILIYSLIQNFVSLIIGIFFSYVFIYLNYKYNIIGLLFKNNILFSMNIFISINNIIFIILLSFFVTFIASIYPMILLKKKNIKDKLDYLK